MQQFQVPVDSETRKRLLYSNTGGKDNEDSRPH